MINSNNLKVSIIVPIYGVEKYILHCLQCIEQQTYQDIECLLINDCTKDNSMQIVDDFLKNKSQKPFIYRVINHNRNMGLSAARNTGLKNASGDYIYFLDSDDYITATCINEMMNIAINYDVDIVWSGIDRIYKDKHKYTPINSENRIYTRKEILEMYISQKLYTEAVNKIIKLKYLQTNNIKFVEGMLHEDVNWTFQLLAPKFTGAILDKPTYSYIQREGSIMSHLTQKNYYDQIKNIKIISNIIKTQNLDKDLVYLKYYQYMIEYSIWLLFYRKSTFRERYDLYKRLRKINVDFANIILNTKRNIDFWHYHFNINNYNLAYIFFEFQNTIRRIKNRIQR